MEAQQIDYTDWSHESLVKRVSELEKKLKDQATSFRTSTSAQPHIPPPCPKPSRTNRVFDPSKYSSRHIALKFAYLGQRYNGFEYHANNNTPLPTVEEALWKALNKAKLIFPTNTHSSKPGEASWEGCEYSKCGRTDKGVSAFGQVIGIRVRSNRPLDQVGSKNMNSLTINGDEIEDEGYKIKQQSDQTQLDPSYSTNGGGDPSSPLPTVEEFECESDPPFDPIRDEIPYPQILNRILPEDIRILAWCPSPTPSFSARFNCKERRYRYFFTQPAFAPTPGSTGLGNLIRDGQSRRREGWLDIEAMRSAAKAFEGTHDFRNFCRVDPGKQITNFERRVFFADVEEVDRRLGPVGYVGRPRFGPLEGSRSTLPDETTNSASDDIKTPRIYTFTVHGSAFLWHQVRCMVAVLFLIGQGLESPALVFALLDIKANPTKPMYEMADDAPLVLWDCIFPDQDSESRDDALEWVYVGDERMAESGKVPGSSLGDGKFGSGGVVDDIWKVWRKRKIDEVLAGMLIDVVVGHGQVDGSGAIRSRSQKVFDGGNAPVMKGTYLPVLKKPRMESVEVVNAKYAAKMGLQNKGNPDGDAMRHLVLNRTDAVSE